MAEVTNVTVYNIGITPKQLRRGTVTVVATAIITKGVLDVANLVITPRLRMLAEHLREKNQIWRDATIAVEADLETPNIAGGKPIEKDERFVSRTEDGIPRVKVTNRRDAQDNKG